MPVDAQISHAAASFRQNAVQLEKCYAGLTPAEWRARPGESSNDMLWIVGHVIWSRAMCLKCMGSPWSRPWMPLFARGAKAAPAADYPSPDELIPAWMEAKAALVAALEDASAEALSAPGPERAPSFDGTLAGTISFFAAHEAYHVGQAAFLRSWLGHEGISG